MSPSNDTLVELRRFRKHVSGIFILFSAGTSVFADPAAVSGDFGSCYIYSNNKVFLCLDVTSTSPATMEKVANRCKTGEIMDGPVKQRTTVWVDKSVCSSAGMVAACDLGNKAAIIKHTFYGYARDLQILTIDKDFCREQKGKWDEPK